MPGDNIRYCNLNSNNLLPWVIKNNISKSRLTNLKPPIVHNAQREVTYLTKIILSWQKRHIKKQNTWIKI